MNVEMLLAAEIMRIATRTARVDHDVDVDTARVLAILTHAGRDETSKLGFEVAHIAANDRDRLRRRILSITRRALSAFNRERPCRECFSREYFDCGYCPDCWADRRQCEPCRLLDLECGITRKGTVR